MRETNLTQQTGDIGLAAPPAVEDERRFLGAHITDAKRAELQARRTMLQQVEVGSRSAPLSPALLAQITELPDIG